MISFSRSIAGSLALTALISASPVLAQVAMEQISPTLNIRQSGSDNRSVVEVTGGAHTGDITQIGDGNQALMLSRGPGSRQSIAQHGADNVGVQMSVGFDNTAVLTQGDASRPGSNNLAVQAQVGARNRARVTQNGSNNAAAQIQTGALTFGQARAVASALTSDLRNGRTDSRLQDLSGLSGGIGNTADLTQDGDDNLAVMIQAGDHNQMDIHQLGGGANVYVQLGDGLRRSATVEQHAGANGVTPITIIQSR